MYFEKPKPPLYISAECLMVDVFSDNLLLSVGWGENEDGNLRVGSHWREHCIAAGRESEPAQISASFFISNTDKAGKNKTINIHQNYKLWQLRFLRKKCKCLSQQHVAVISVVEKFMFPEEKL